ncbi:MAG: hypothetical protein ABSF00_01050 [Candidatus Bathyarchaeia archaeon]
MKTPNVLAVLVLLDSLLMAYGHVPIIRAIFFSFSIGGYFLFATVVFILGGIFVAANKLFKLSIVALVIMAIVDNLLLIYTRIMPNIFFHRMLSWSWGWVPLGTVQVLVGQTVLIVLCAILYKTKSSSTK